MVAPPAETAAKTVLYLAMKESGVGKAELARRLACDEKEVRRLLDPHHASKLPRLARAVALLGKRLVIDMEPA
jgi:antitoxin HicB